MIMTKLAPPKAPGENSPVFPIRISFAQKVEPSDLEILLADRCTGERTAVGIVHVSKYDHTAEVAVSQTVKRDGMFQTDVHRYTVDLVRNQATVTSVGLVCRAGQNASIEPWTSAPPLSEVAKALTTARNPR
jgi:hypothetical protein